MTNIGIFGSTGYAGNQLVNLLNNHPKVNIKFVTSESNAGKSYSELYPKLLNKVDLKLINKKQALTKINNIDLIFLALPHTLSMNLVKKVIEINKNLKIIDLSGDFRLKNFKTYKKYYNKKHTFKNHLNKFVYGLTEINYKKIKKSKYIANPGCYPTSCILPLYPLVKEDIINKDNIVIDSKSGLSGAGRKTKTNLLFSEANENIYAYKTNNHRHQPEINEHLEKSNVLFNPHIIPTTRGIYSTIYCNLNKEKSKQEIDNIYNKYYSNKHFINLLDKKPKSKNVLRTNNCNFSYTLDNKNKRLIIFSTIDNLMKGAAGQAVQNMNLMFNFKENLGLENFNFYL
ncbi:MAG: N-acetyl-gamma-glutamyl-phosphate reductase [Bacillota bacterium]